MIDINGKNNMVARKLFEKLCPDAKANIEQIDRKNGFLSDKPLIFNEKEVKEFDIVIGNPPFQGGAVKSVGTRKVEQEREEKGIDVSKNKNLWVPFVKKILSKYLKENGYMLIVHPVGWFKTYGPFQHIHDIILEKQLMIIKNFKDSQFKDIFGESANITSAYYLLQNKSSTKDTILIDSTNRKSEVKLDKKYPIILAYNNILYRIIEKCKLFKDTELFEQKSLGVTDCNNAGTNKNIAGIDDTGKILIAKSIKKHPYHNTPKIFIDGSSKLKYYYDKDGEYGIIGQNQFYVTGDNLEDIEQYFKTKLANFLNKNIKYRQNFIEPRYQPDVRVIPKDKLKNNKGKVTGEINDETLANYFAFTKEETAVINATENSHDKYTITGITCAQLKGEKGEVGEEGGSRKERRVTRKLRRT
jgi:hypothetical protein